MIERFEDPRPKCREPECPWFAVLIVRGVALCSGHALEAYLRRHQAVA